MQVDRVTPIVDDEGETISEDVTLTAVYGTGGQDNAQWAKWTPYGLFDITITNPSAFGKLQLGREFYVDFVPVEAEQEQEM